MSWNDAQAFCRWAGLSLPTEGQWEYACRAGTETERFWGDENRGAARYANVSDETSRKKYRWKHCFEGEDDGYAETAPVGRFLPNPWGLYDLLGNVWEWCQDWYGPYRSATVSDPSGPETGTARVLRGGAWFSEPSNVRSANRSRDAPGDRDANIGFRGVCPVPGASH